MVKREEEEKMELDLEELDLDMVSGSDGVEVGASGMEGGGFVLS